MAKHTESLSTQFQKTLREFDALAEGAIEFSRSIFVDSYPITMHFLRVFLKRLFVFQVPIDF